MSQERINSLMAQYVHNDLSGKVELNSIGNNVECMFLVILVELFTIYLCHLPNWHKLKVSTYTYKQNNAQATSNPTHFLASPLVKWWNHPCHCHTGRKRAV